MYLKLQLWHLRRHPDYYYLNNHLLRDDFGIFDSEKYIYCINFSSRELNIIITCLNLYIKGSLILNICYRNLPYFGPKKFNAKIC